MSRAGRFEDVRRNILHHRVFFARGPDGIPVAIPLRVRGREVPAAAGIEGISTRRLIMSASQTQNQATIVNGVDVPRVLETVKAIQLDPSLGEFHFRAKNRWLGGSRNRSEIKDFHGAGREDTTRESAFILENDEPTILVGTDRAPNPGEQVIHGLAGCLTTAIVYHAAARGIEIGSVESKLESDIDLRGFLGISDQVRKGYSEIRVTLKVESDASAEQLAELAEFSPMLDTLRRPVNVVVRVEKA
jgi:uncharacterized OsmC-like protein